MMTENSNFWLELIKVILSLLLGIILEKKFKISHVLSRENKLTNLTQITGNNINNFIIINNNRMPTIGSKNDTNSFEYIEEKSSSTKYSNSELEFLIEEIKILFNKAKLNWEGAEDLRRAYDYHYNKGNYKIAATLYFRSLKPLLEVINKSYYNMFNDCLSELSKWSSYGYGTEEFDFLIRKIKLILFNVFINNN